MKKGKKSEKSEDLVKVILDVSDATLELAANGFGRAHWEMICMKSAILLGIRAT